MQLDQRAEPGASAEALHPDWNAEDHLIRLLADNARDHGAEIAMRERDHGIWKCYTWNDYLERVLLMAAGLDALGLEPRDNVLVIGDNRPELYFGMLAVIALRAVPSPAYPDATPAEIADQVRREDIRYALAEDQEQVDKLCDIRERDGGLDIILYDDPRGLAGKEPEGVIALEEIARRGAERLADGPGLREELLSRATAHDAAVLLHSSGSTGRPKGIPLKHGHLLASVRNAARAGYFREGEVHMAYLPMAWVGDFIFSVCAALALRFSVNIPERQETALHDLREIGPTVYFSSPRAWSNMLTRIQVGIGETSRFKRAL
ncbi:MAG: AMP-binding protein, partial [Planctomycetota bacterium]|nr:AMP-binding protein [Planctomycetota bacterium]